MTAKAGFRRARLRRAATVLVATLAASLTVFGAPPASAGTPAPLTTASGSVGALPRTLSPTLPAATLPADLTLTAVTPPVATGTAGVTVTGTIRSTTGATYVDPEIRIVRPRPGILTRADVTAWATDANPVTNGTELARATISAHVGPETTATYTMTLTPAALRLNRTSGVVPIDIQLVTSARVQASLHTFVGWQQAPETTALSISWLMPLTLDPDPALHSANPSTRTAAWTAAVGSDSRLTRLLTATATTSTGYAVDPAVLGPASPSETGATGATETTGATGVPNIIDAARARVAGALAAQQNAMVGADEIAARRSLAAALSTAAATHPIWTLPQDDPDLGALFASGVDLRNPAISAWLHGLTAPSPLLTAVTQSGTGSASTLTHVAWPADGRLPVGREEAVRTAYGQWGPDVLLVSTEATNVDPEVTPQAAARTPQGQPVLRYDETLAAIASRVHRPADVGLAGQEFLAQTATLWAQAPVRERSLLVVLPRDFDTDPDAFAAFRQLTDTSPWAAVGRVGDALDTSRAANTEFVDPVLATSPASDAVLDAPLAERLANDRATLTTYLALSSAPSSAMSRWWDLVDTAAGVRWRSQPAAHAGLIAELDRGVAALESGLVIAEQTTNFLADEGVLLVTVVNDLDVGVDDVQVNLAPTNARMYVVEPAPPLHIGAHSKATARVRLAAAAQGLVPIDAWLTAAHGDRISATTRITVRAAPPGVWLYIVGGVIVGGLAIVGAVQALSKPRREVPGIDLDPIQPTPEAPVSAPIEHPDSALGLSPTPASHPVSDPPDA